MGDMQIPVEITFKEMERSAAVETRIRELAARLERVYDRVVRCDVMVETPHRHQRNGRQYHVRVRLTVPGGEIVASHDPGPDGAHEDVYVAIRDTFAAAKRQLEDFARKSLKRGEVDWVTFTSSSTVKNLVTLLGATSAPAISSRNPAASSSMGRM